MLVRRVANHGPRPSKCDDAKEETVGTTEKLGSPGVLFGGQAADQGNADAQIASPLRAPRGQPNIVTSAATLHHRGRRSRTARLPHRQREWVRPTAPPSEHSPGSRDSFESGSRDSLNEGVLQARACIRDNIRAAYQSSESVDQATSFLMRSCFGPFSSAIPSGEASATTLFKRVVIQEIRPDDWLRALEEGRLGAVTPTCKFRSLRRSGRPLRMQRNACNCGCGRPQSVPMVLRDRRAKNAVARRPNETGWASLRLDNRAKAFPSIQHCASWPSDPDIPSSS